MVQFIDSKEKVHLIPIEISEERLRQGIKELKSISKPRIRRRNYGNVKCFTKFDNGALGGSNYVQMAWRRSNVNAFCAIMTGLVAGLVMGDVESDDCHRSITNDLHGCFHQVALCQQNHQLRQRLLCQCVARGI